MLVKLWGWLAADDLSSLLYEVGDHILRYREVDEVIESSSILSMRRRDAVCHRGGSERCR